MQALNLADYITIGFYFLILIAAGFILSRRASQSLEDYFLGGRKLPWWALGMSGTASWFDITGTALIVSFLYMLGPRGLYIEFRGGACLVLAFMLAFTGKWHRRSSCITGAEWMVFRFGEGIGAQLSRILIAVGAITSSVGMIAYMIKGVGPFLHIFLGWSPMTCALVMICVATLYTMASGFYGVVVTDVIQTMIIFIVVGFIVVIAVAHAADVSDLDVFAEKVTARDFWPSEGEHRSSWTTSEPSWRVPMQKGYRDYSWLTMFAMFYFVRQILEGLRSGGDQRYFGARNERECGLLSAMWGGLIMVRWPMMIGFAMLGLFMVDRMFGQRPPDTLVQARTAIMADALAEEAPGESFDLDKAVTAGTILPTWQWADASAVGITLSDSSVATDELKKTLGPQWETKLAGLVSTFGPAWPAELQKLAAQEERIGKLVPKALWGETIAAAIGKPELTTRLKSILGETDFETKIKLVSYEGTVNPELILPAVLLERIKPGIRGLLLVALLAASMSTFDSTVNMATSFFTRDIYQRYLHAAASNRELIVASYAFGVMLVAASFGLAFKAENINKIWGWIIMSLTAGMVVPGVLRLYWWRFNAGGVVASSVIGLVWPIVQYFALSDLHEWYQFLIVIGITLVAALIGTFAAPPTDRRTLEHFYKLTRPFGLWKPLKGVLHPDVRVKMEREHRNDLIAIPFALATQVTLFLLPMQLVIRSWDDFAVTAVIFVVGLLGLYKFWYKNLPPAREGVATEAEIDAGHI